MRVVAKIGTSSLTGVGGRVKSDAVVKLCDEVAAAQVEGHELILVTSGAITAGLPHLGFAENRPRDINTLQAAAAVGQSRLLKTYDEAFAPHGIVAGQVLLSPRDFLDRGQYLHARATMNRMLQLGAVPIINENDAVSDIEIRWGDNDRLAALVAHALNADLLVLLTDTAGVYTANPHLDENASLVSEITEVDEYLSGASGSSSTVGSGGMASKLLAARMASRSGVRAVIAAASKPAVIADAIHNEPDVGTIVLARSERLSARKLWIAYALQVRGRVTIDDGARSAIVERNKSLLLPGVTEVSGEFSRDDGIEVLDRSGVVVAKGMSRLSVDEVRGASSGELLHRDDLVVLA